MSVNFHFDCKDYLESVHQAFIIIQWSSQNLVILNLGYSRKEDNLERMADLPLLYDRKERYETTRRHCERLGQMCLDILGVILLSSFCFVVIIFWLHSYDSR